MQLTLSYSIGPIVRITPHELHVADSKFWNTLYGPGRTDKYDVFKQRQNIPGSIFATPESDLHRLRKAPLLPLFSKQRIYNFQPVIQEKLDILCSKIDEYVQSGKNFRINNALTAFSGDVITTYVFGEAYNHLQSPEFEENFHEPFMAASEAGHMANQFHWLWKLMERLPDSVVMLTQPIVMPVIRLERVSTIYLYTPSSNAMPLADRLTLQQDFDAKLKAIKAGTAKENPDHPTILFELIRSDLPPEEKTTRRLTDEAQLLVAAGLTTTAWAMSVTAFYIIQHKAIYEKLRAELERAIPDSNKSVSLQSVEKLPYLNACIREGLRLSYGVSARNPRLWDRPLKYAGWTIPPRTPVSLTIVDHNHNEEIFPDSWAFKPERWLDNPSMDQWFFSFGKGSRSCLGIK